jgi:hypothetical protein
MDNAECFTMVYNQVGEEDILFEEDNEKLKGTTRSVGSLFISIHIHTFFSNSLLGA